MTRIAISTSSFGSADPAPLRRLEAAGVDVRNNPYGRRLTEQEIIDHLNGVDGLVAGLEPLNRTVLESADRLKAIARVGIGMDNIDLEAARELGIKVSNTPDPPARAVAEMTLTAALALSRGLVESDRAMHDGRWEKQVTKGLRGTRVLLIGLGRIGREVARLMSTFGARIAAVDPYLDADAFGDVERVALAEGLARADVVSLHASGRDPILGSAEFEAMTHGAILLNGARGELVDEDALVGALDSGKVAGAWFDAFWEEPYDGRLRDYPQVLMTPHVSTYTESCRRAMETGAVENVLRDLAAAGEGGAAGAP